MIRFLEAKTHIQCDCLDGHIACRVFQDAKPALKACTLRKRREIFDWIHELTKALIPVSAFHTQRQVEAARCRAVETWLQRNRVITITQNEKVLPIFPKKLLITPHFQFEPYSRNSGSSPSSIFMRV
jgi:hypothetical protein